MIQCINLLHNGVNRRVSLRNRPRHQQYSILLLIAQVNQCMYSTRKYIVQNTVSML